MDVYGVIGWPITHSLSPDMHNAAFKKLGINAEYRKFEVKPEGLEDFLLDRKDVAGFNITIPHKVRAKEILEKKFPPGAHVDAFLHLGLAGAINTVKRHSGILEYLNTDVYGFQRSLKEDMGFDAGNKDVFLIGCGGAGRAIVSALTVGEKPVHRIYIYENNEKVVESIRRHFSQFPFLQEKLEFISDREMPGIIKKCRLLVNASPVGMKEGEGSVINRELLHKDLSIYDVVYNRETQLIKDARRLGLRSADGLGMLLYQGVRAFQFWTQREAPVEVMKNALKKAIT